MIYEVSKKKKKKMKIRKRSMKPQPNMQHNLLLLEATTKHGHLTKSSWSGLGDFLARVPESGNPVWETMRCVGDNKPNHYGYDNAAKKMDPEQEPRAGPHLSGCSRVSSACV